MQTNHLRKKSIAELQIHLLIHEQMLIKRFSSRRQLTPLNKIWVKGRERAVKGNIRPIHFWECVPAMKYPEILKINLGLLYISLRKWWLFFNMANFWNWQFQQQIICMQNSHDDGCNCLLTLKTIYFAMIEMKGFLLLIFYNPPSINVPFHHTSLLQKSQPRTATPMAKSGSLEDLLPFTGDLQE